MKTMQALGIDCGEDILEGVTREYTQEELTFSMGEEHFKEFMGEYSRYSETT